MQLHWPSLFNTYLNSHLPMQQFLIFRFSTKLRRFYTRRNVSGILRRHRSCTCVKVLFTNTLPKCRFRWKVRIISTFPLRTEIAFFLIQLFLSIHVNKVSLITWLINSLQYNLKVKWLLVNKLNMTLDN